MNTRIEEKYTLNVWIESYNRYVEYFSYTTLKRLKEQIDRCIEDYHNSYNYRRKHHYSSWDIWRGCRRVDLKTAKYIIEYKQYKITKEELLSEVVENGRN